MLENSQTHGITIYGRSDTTLNRGGRAAAVVTRDAIETCKFAACRRSNWHRRNLRGRRAVRRDRRLGGRLEARKCARDECSGGNVSFFLFEIARSFFVLERNDEFSNVCRSIEEQNERVHLFVRMSNEHRLTDELRTRICRELRSKMSPRHVPDAVDAIVDIPYTSSGKKVEIAVKQILNGEEASRAALGDARRSTFICAFL